MKRLLLFTLCLLAAGAAFGQKKNAAAKGPGPKSQAEQQALQAMIQAPTPDEKIKAADDLITRFPSTDYKSAALEIEAEAYQQKGDNTKAIVFGEQSLQADPKNFTADNLLANVTTATTRENDLDRDEKLAKAEKYAHDALDILNTGEKPWTIGDEQWPRAKAASIGLAYQALGNVALARKKTDEAVADYEKGIAANPDPILMIRVGRALMAAKKPDEAVTWFEKAMNDPNTPANIKSIAQADRVRAIQAKGTAAK